MDKPDEMMFKIYEFGTIEGIRVRSEHDGVGIQSWAWWILMGHNHDARLTKPKPIELEITESQGLHWLNLKPDHFGLAHLKEGCVQQIRDWKDFEKKNRKELREYERLKEKYG